MSGEPIVMAEVSRTALRTGLAGFASSADGTGIRKSAMPKISKGPSITAEPMMPVYPSASAGFDFGTATDRPRAR